MSNKARHIAIIMDGNGRWATAQGKKRIVGHEKGAETVRDITTYCSNREEIERLTLYAFSTENWKRPKYEVDFLMRLLDSRLKKELPVYLENGVRFEPIGDLSHFSQKLRKTIETVREKTAGGTKLTQTLALNYGAKDEIVRAAQKLCAAGETINETNLDAALDTNLNVDILIRTGGDKRLSNFMLWQAAYAELFFSETLWPDFNERELARIIEKFRSIERRFGGLK